MSETIECKQVCDDCPLREGFDVTPTHFVETGWSALGTIHDQGRSASIELSYGEPVGERTSTVAMAHRDSIGNKRDSEDFEVSGTQFDNGTLVEAFDVCDGPTFERSGFMNLRKTMGCTALRTLQENR